MKLTSLLLLSGMSMLLACSKAEIISDYDKQVDFSHYRSFAVCSEDIDFEDHAGSIYDNINTRLLIADAITAELQQYYAANTPNADLRAGFHIVKDKRKFVYSNCSMANFYRTWPAFSYDAVEYTEGTLIVYLADVVRNQVIWQASASSAIRKTEGNEMAIKKTVQSLFNNFPLYASKHA